MEGRRFLEGLALATILILFCALCFSILQARRAHVEIGEAKREIESLKRAFAHMHFMEDFSLIQKGSEWFAIVRQEGEGDDQFAARMNGISTGAIDPMETHLCATVSGCSEGRSVTVCIAILPGFTQAQNEAKLASLKAAVCAELECTVGCS